MPPPASSATQPAPRPPDAARSGSRSGLAGGGAAHAPSARAAPPDPPPPDRPAADRSLSSASSSDVTLTQASAADAGAGAGAGASAPAPPRPHLDLATYPSRDLLRVLAALLQQIATANDRLRPRPSGGSSHSHSHSHSHSRSARHAPTIPEAPGAPVAEETAVPVSGAHAHAPAPSEPGSNPPASSRREALESSLDRISGSPQMTSAAQGALTTVGSTLCFHARTVPSISIADYLLRILKYCPTTNEVFISLLVYFDRMSRMGGTTFAPSSPEGEPASAVTADSLTQSHLSPLDRLVHPPAPAPDASAAAPGDDELVYPGMKGFAIDSFNVHRLVIAGITVASKFFSDVFYTNSRYAKVGGLGVTELNQLELQFLLLNDFHLSIPLDEFQRYADQLLQFGSGQAPPPQPLQPPPTSHSAPHAGHSGRTAQHPTPASQPPPSTSHRHNHDPRAHFAVPMSRP